MVLLSLVSGRDWEAGGREGHCAFKIILKVRTLAPTSSAALDSLLRVSGSLKGCIPPRQASKQGSGRMDEVMV